MADGAAVPLGIAPDDVKPEMMAVAKATGSTVAAVAAGAGVGGPPPVGIVGVEGEEAGIGELGGVGERLDGVLCTSTGS